MAGFPHPALYTCQQLGSEPPKPEHLFRDKVGPGRIRRSGKLDNVSAVAEPRHHLKSARFAVSHFMSLRSSKLVHERLNDAKNFGTRRFLAAVDKPISCLCDVRSIASGTPAAHDPRFLKTEFQCSFCSSASSLVIHVEVVLLVLLADHLVIAKIFNGC